MIYMRSRSTQPPGHAGNALRSPEQKPRSANGIKPVSVLLDVKALRQGKTQTNRRGFNEVDSISILFQSLVHSNPYLLVSLTSRVFEPWTIQGSKPLCQKNCPHVRNFLTPTVTAFGRDSTRVGRWTLPWHTTGKSPLFSEDGEILRVLRSFNHTILRIDNTVDSPH